MGRDSQRTAHQAAAARAASHTPMSRNRPRAARVALFSAIDTNGDATLSASASKAFIDPLTSQVQQMTSTASPPSTTSTGSSTTKASRQRNGLARLADFARHQYDRATNGWNTSSNASSLNAVA